jgi:DnaJ-class molecular chaperone
MKEFYELLGVSETATDEEITNRYNELKEKYREERWQDGEAGNEAARMLTKIEVAYKEVMDERRERSENTAGTDSYEEIARKWGECIRTENGFQDSGHYDKNVKEHI